jgi:hypothetical protein
MHLETSIEGNLSYMTIENLHGRMPVIFNGAVLIVIELTRMPVICKGEVVIVCDAVSIPVICKGKLTPK